MSQCTDYVNQTLIPVRSTVNPTVEIDESTRGIVRRPRHEISVYSMGPHSPGSCANSFHPPQAGHVLAVDHHLSWAARSGRLHLDGSYSRSRRASAVVRRISETEKNPPARSARFGQSRCREL